MGSQIKQPPFLAWKRVKSLIRDFTCVHRLAARYDGKAKQDGASIATAAEVRKGKKSEDLASQCVFQSVPVETLGGFGTRLFLFYEMLAAASPIVQMIHERLFIFAKDLPLLFRKGMPLASANRVIGA